MARTAATAYDVRRLAAEAERRGNRILVEPVSGEHVPTSAADLVRLHRVTGCSCTRRGCFSR